MPGKKRTLAKAGKKSKVAVGKKSASKRKRSLPSPPASEIHELQVSARHLQIVLDAANIGIWDWDLKTNVVQWGGHSHDIYKSRHRMPNTMEGYFELIHPLDRERIKMDVEESLRARKTFQAHYRINANDGSIRWIETFGSVVYDKTGKAVTMSGTIQDVTSKKIFETEREGWKQRHDMISSSAGLVIYDYDIHTGDILWSGSSYEVLGYYPEELGNIDQWVDQIHPDDRTEAFSLLEDAQRRLQPYDVYYRFRMKNGDYCHFHDRGLFIAEGGVARRMLGIMTDVSKRVKIEESLRESEQRFRTLQQASFGGIGLHDKGIILDCNQGLCDISGYSHEELIGSNGLELVAPEWRDFVKEKIISGYDKTYDVEGVRKDGSQYFLEIRGKNIPFENRTIRVTEFRDITERKKSEQTIVEQNTKLVALTEEMRRKNKQLEEFTQIVSHNLRSPVGNILTLLNFHEGAESKEEKSEYITLLKESAVTTLTMLNELNDVLKIKQSKNMDKQWLTFESVLLQIRSMLNARITELSAELVYDFTEVPRIEYPSIYLESILLNLLDNALKYNSPLRKPIIQLRSYHNEHGNLMLSVSDNGIGINMDRYKHQIFKLRKTFHQHPESRGIGLFMVKNQIEAMGGEITIASRENEGTTFFINFNKYQSDGF